MDYEVVGDIQPAVGSLGSFLKCPSEVTTP